MEVKYSFFCEAAATDSSGRLSVLGIFDIINALELPAMYPHLTFVVAIAGHRSELGLHQLKINFIDTDGKPFLPPLELSFELTRDRPNSNIILNLNNITFSHSGTYCADIVVDNHHLKTVELMIKKINQ